MIASRRCPNATLPSSHWPWPSGPRCASTRAMRSTARRSAGRPSKFKNPQIPHMSRSVPARNTVCGCRTVCRFLGDDADAGLFNKFSLDRQPERFAPVAQFFRSMPMRIQGRIPVEINVVHFIEGELRLIEGLEHMPIKEALQVYGARRDLQDIDRLGNLDDQVEVAEDLAQAA